MKKFTLSLASIVALSTLSFAGGDIVEPPVETPTEKSCLAIGANMTLASKYVWRGQDQNSGNPAVQGGVDVSYCGFYVGVWASNGDFDTFDALGLRTASSSIEVDIYAGYKFEVATVGFDIGYIAYLYPGVTSEWDDVAKEVYVGVRKEFGDFGIGAKLYYDFDNLNEDLEDGYYTAEFSASYKLPYDIALAGTFGMDNMAGHTDDYYYSIGASKAIDKFTVGVAYHGYYSDALDDTTDNIVGYISASF